MDYLKETNDPENIIITDELDDVEIPKETAQLILDFIRNGEAGSTDELTLPDATVLDMNFRDRGTLNIDVYYGDDRNGLCLMWWNSEVEQMEEELSEVLNQ